LDDKPFLKGAWSGSHDPFSVLTPAIMWEISDNISLMVQDRSIVTVEIRNRMWPIEWHQYQCSWIKVTFTDWNLSNCHTSWNPAWTY